MSVRRQAKADIPGIVKKTKEKAKGETSPVVTVGGVVGPLLSTLFPYPSLERLNVGTYSFHPTAMSMFEGSSSAACPSFTAYLQGVQQEASVLKCLAQLRTLPPGDDLAARLLDIEAAVTSIEQNMEEFNEFLSGEQRICDLLEAEAIRDAEKHRAQIDAIEEAMMASCRLPPPVAPAAAAAKLAAGSSSSKGGVLHITPVELESVPKSTRGRSVTVGVVNAALSHIKALADDKEKALAVPRKKMNAKQMQVGEAPGSLARGTPPFIPLPPISSLPPPPPGRLPPAHPAAHTHLCAPLGRCRWQKPTMP